MTTLADMMSDIADDIDDTTAEYSDQIKKAIQAAQRFCERSSYYFNETRDVTFTTVADQQWYGSAANSNIPTLIRIAAAYREDSDGQRTQLIRATPDALESVSDNSASSGQPTHFTYFNKQIRLYPVPDASSYTIRLQLGPYRLTSLSASDDTNAWLTEAYDMIKAYAKYILARDTLKDNDEALKYLAVYQGEERALTGETASRHGTGYVCPTEF